MDLCSFNTGIDSLSFHSFHWVEIIQPGWGGGEKLQKKKNSREFSTRLQSYLLRIRESHLGKVGASETTYYLELNLIRHNFGCVIEPMPDSSTTLPGSLSADGHLNHLINQWLALSSSPELIKLHWCADLGRKCWEGYQPPSQVSIIWSVSHDLKRFAIESF